MKLLSDLRSKMEVYRKENVFIKHSKKLPLVNSLPNREKLKKGKQDMNLV